MPITKVLDERQLRLVVGLHLHQDFTGISPVSSRPHHVGVTQKLYRSAVGIAYEVERQTCAVRIPVQLVPGEIYGPVSRIDLAGHYELHDTVLQDRMRHRDVGDNNRNGENDIEADYQNSAGKKPGDGYLRPRHAPSTSEFAERSWRVA